ncbi:MAG TPA: hypothetical protein ENN68_05685 [Methanomicrobia archaeon]|nr:hypothetical protein [Methanomicrobia archaeon]
MEPLELRFREWSINRGEHIVGILVTAKHRQNAFRACEYRINELKSLVLIWQRRE